MYYLSVLIVSFFYWLLIIKINFEDDLHLFIIKFKNYLIDMNLYQFFKL